MMAHREVCAPSPLVAEAAVNSDVMEMGTS